MSGAVATPGLRLRRLRSTPLTVAFAAVVLTVLLVCAVAPWLAPLDPTEIDNDAVLQGPSPGHLLGTDELGRDVLSRVVYGARSALVGPLILALVTVVLSTVLALLAGWKRGWVDGLIGRTVDFLYSVPALVVAIVVVGVVGGGYWLAIGVLVVFGLPQNVRVVRAAVLERVNLPYVEAARTLGIRGSRIVARHLLPGIAPVLVASFFLQFAYGIVDLSSLAFLGLGVPPGSPDWGRQLAENRVSIYSNAWAAAAPCIALVAAATAMNLMGDWLHTRFEQGRRAR